MEDPEEWRSLRFTGFVLAGFVLGCLADWVLISQRWRKNRREEPVTEETHLETSPPRNGDESAAQPTRRRTDLRHPASTAQGRSQTADDEALFAGARRQPPQVTTLLGSQRSPNREASHPTSPRASETRISPSESLSEPPEMMVNGLRKRRSSRELAHQAGMLRLPETPTSRLEGTVNLSPSQAKVPQQQQRLQSRETHGHVAPTAAPAAAKVLPRAASADVEDEEALFAAARHQPTLARAEEMQRSPDREANYSTLQQASDSEELPSADDDEEALFSAARLIQRYQPTQARAEETQSSPDREANHSTLPRASNSRKSTGPSPSLLPENSATKHKSSSPAMSSSETESKASPSPTSPSYTPQPAMRYGDSDSDRDTDDHFRRCSSRQDPSPPDREHGRDLGWSVLRRPQLSISRSEGCITDLTPSQARILRQQQQRLSERISQALTDTPEPGPEGEHVSTYGQYGQFAAVEGPPQSFTEAVGPVETEVDYVGPIQLYEDYLSEIRVMTRSMSQGSFFDLLADEERASLGGATAPWRSARYVLEQLRA